MKHANLVVVLVAPENVDNIGAVARALKNTGFSELRLVRPPKHWRTKGRKMAMSAADVLRRGKEFVSLEKAVYDLNFVVGTTRRQGTGRGFFLPFRETLEKVRKSSARLKTGIVFGCESKGLANKDSALCDQLVTIPASLRYPSFNLAQAVMVTLFSLSLSPGEERSGGQERFLNKKETGIALKHFEAALKALGYRRGGNDLLPRILGTMKGLFKRSGLLGPEAQMIKGLSRRIREKILSCRVRKCKIERPLRKEKVF